MDAMIVLEEALREGHIDKEALADICDATRPKMTTNVFWDEYCELDPSAPGCLIYDV